MKFKRQKWTLKTNRPGVVRKPGSDTLNDVVQALVMPEHSSWYVSGRLAFIHHQSDAELSENGSQWDTCFFYPPGAGMLSHFSHVPLFAALWTLAQQASLFVAILQARILEWVAIPSPGDLPDPGIEPESLMSPALAGRVFTTSTTWEAHPAGKESNSNSKHLICASYLPGAVQNVLYLCWLS